MKGLVKCRKKLSVVINWRWQCWKFSTGTSMWSWRRARGRSNSSRSWGTVHLVCARYLLPHLASGLAHLRVVPCCRLLALSSHTHLFHPQSCRFDLALPPMPQLIDWDSDLAQYTNLHSHHGSSQIEGFVSKTQWKHLGGGLSVGSLVQNPQGNSAPWYSSPISSPPTWWNNTELQENNNSEHLVVIFYPSKLFQWEGWQQDSIDKTLSEYP